MAPFAPDRGHFGLGLYLHTCKYFVCVGTSDPFVLRLKNSFLYSNIVKYDFEKKTRRFHTGCRLVNKLLFFFVFLFVFSTSPIALFIKVAVTFIRRCFR